MSNSAGERYQSWQDYARDMEIKVARLEGELLLAQRMHDVAVAERDYERARNNKLDGMHIYMPECTGPVYCKCGDKK